MCVCVVFVCCVFVLCVFVLCFVCCVVSCVLCVPSVAHFCAVGKFCGKFHHGVRSTCECVFCTTGARANISALCFPLQGLGKT